MTFFAENEVAHLKKALFRNIIIPLIITNICILTTILVLFDHNATYFVTAILPISFLFCHSLLYALMPETSKTNIGYILFGVQSFAKCVLGPLFLYLGNYTSLFSSLNRNAIANATLLIVYEQIVCSLTIFFTKDTYHLLDKERSIRSSKINIRYIVWGLVLIMVLLWILIPAISANYTTVFEMNENRNVFSGADYTSEYSIGNVNRIFTTLFLVLFKSFRIIFPFYIIKSLHSKYNNMVSFISSILMIFVQFIFIPGTMLTPFIISIMLLVYLLSIYDKYRKEIYLIAVISFAFVVLLLSIWFEKSAKWYGINSISEYLSMSLQGYVPGVCNVASTFRVERSDRLETLLDTIVACVPFQSSIFGSTLFSMDLNTRFVSTSGLASQIVSTVGGGWYIFGYFLSPVFSILFTRVSVLSGYRYKSTKNETYKLFYLFMCIQSILGVGIYNIQTTITNWLQVGFVLWLYARYSEDNEEHKNEKNIINNTAVH